MQLSMSVKIFSAVTDVFRMGGLFLDLVESSFVKSAVLHEQNAVAGFTNKFC